MSLADEYHRQFTWRDWVKALDALPSLDGKTVLDLGCGPGDLAEALVGRGAFVLGIDGNEELIDAARNKGLETAEFRVGDLENLPYVDPVDGIWCSFTAAYLRDLPGTLRTWASRLKPGGWMALTEIDDLFNHEPVRDQTRELLADYVDEALRAGRYDFKMGRKLRGYVEGAGLLVKGQLCLPDAELAFDGPGQEDVIEAWRARFERMSLLRVRCGDQYERVRDDFLGCLKRVDHRANSSVRFVLACAYSDRPSG
ncbi:MAG: class I SAM-dependent methyltransferase [Deltaproteobacteria bacterium]|nr:class I SAM-dependent methyltransferase [Deltaproteobacteria bacterium]